MLSAPKTPKAKLCDCPGFDYYAPVRRAPEAASPQTLRILTPLEQMYGYYEAA